MRRCLRAFLVGLLVLSLPGGPAHACWRSRQARHCRPVVVMPCCPPTAWAACGESVITVLDSCPPVAACCGEVVVADSSWGSAELVTEAVVAEGVVAVETPAPAAAVAEPTSPAVAASEPRQPGLEPIAPPPTLEPTGDGVTPTSNEQPVPAEPAVNEPPAATDSRDLADPEMPESQNPVSAIADDAAPAAGDPELPLVPADDAATEPATEPADEAPADAADEPPMEEEPEPVEPEDSVEPPPTSEEEPQPEPEPEPQPEPEPEPEEGNIFDELDAEDAGDELADEQEMTEPAAEEPAADPFGELDTEDEMVDDQPVDEPAPAEPADEEPADEEPAVPAEEPTGEDDSAPTDEGSPDDSEAADPFAEDESAEGDEPADEMPTDDEPAAADPFAASEPLRRWIDTSGTAAIVGVLVDVGADGRCVLETRGRRIVVPIENLSRHDQEYVRRAGSRLATIRGQEAGDTVAAPGPAPTDTAGR